MRVSRGISSIAVLIALGLLAWVLSVRQIMSAGERWGASLRALRNQVPKSAFAAEPPALPPPSSEDRGALDVREAAHTVSLGPRRAAPRVPPLARGVYIPAKTVLGWSQLHRAPSALPVAAQGSRPSGIELQGVSPFGAGVEDGDILLEVNGRPATSYDQVVATVLSARGAHAATISARLWRNGQTYPLTVELPYLDSSGELQHDAENVANDPLH